MSSERARGPRRRPGGRRGEVAVPRGAGRETPKVAGWPGGRTDGRVDRWGARGRAALRLPPGEVWGIGCEPQRKAGRGPPTPPPGDAAALAFLSTLATPLSPPGTLTFNCFLKN